MSIQPHAPQEPLSLVSVETMAAAILDNNLNRMNPQQRVEYVLGVCQSLNLNPLTRPFQLLALDGGMQLYATKSATDQVRRNNKINLSIVGRERIEDVYVVTARAITVDGRQDEATGVVAIAGKRGDALANALMKAETKAKRRVTLSICGLGMLDESELETIQGAQPVSMDYASGEIAPLGNAPAAPRFTEGTVATQIHEEAPAPASAAPKGPPARPDSALIEEPVDGDTKNERLRRLIAAAEANGVPYPGGVAEAAKAAFGHASASWFSDAQMRRLEEGLIPAKGQDIRAEAFTPEYDDSAEDETREELPPGAVGQQ